MAKSDVLYIPSKYQAFGVNFVESDGVAVKELLVVPADDANLIWLNITSTNTAALDLLLYISIGGLDFQIGHIDIPAEAGTNGTTTAVAGLNMLGTALVDDTTINKYLPLKGGTILKASMRVSVAASKLVAVTGVISDYSL